MKEKGQYEYDEKNLTYTVYKINIFAENSKEELIEKLYGFPNNERIADLVFEIKGFYSFTLLRFNFIVN